MSQFSDRLRYVNRVVGGVLVLIFLSLVIVLILWTQRQDFFARTVQVPAHINPADRNGIKVGTEVLFLGIDVGEVKSMEPVENGKMIELMLEIKTETYSRILEDSPENFSGYFVRLRHRLAGAGEPYLEILPDLNNQITEPLPHLVILPEPNPATQAAGSADKIEKHIGGISVDFRGIRDQIQIIQDSIEVNARQTTEAIQKIQEDFQIIRQEVQAFQASITEDATRTRKSVEHIQEDFGLIRFEVQQFQKSVTADATQARQAVEKIHAEFGLIRLEVQAFQESSSSNLELSRKAVEKIQEDFQVVTREVQAFQDSTTRDVELTRKAVEQAQHDFADLSLDTRLTLRSFDDNFHEIQSSIGDIRDSTRINFQKVGDSAESISESSESIAREVQQSNAKLQRILTDLEAVTPKLDPLLIRTQFVMENLSDITTIVRKEAQDLPGTVRKTNQTLDETQFLIESIQNSPLISPHVNRPFYTPIVPPSQIGP